MYKYHSIDKCNAFYPNNTKKDMDGRLANQDITLKHFKNTKKKTQKQMKASKNHNNMLYNTAKKVVPVESCKSLKVPNLDMIPP